MKLPHISVEIQTTVAAAVTAASVYLGMRNQYGFGPVWFVFAGFQLSAVLQGFSAVHAKSKKTVVAPADEWSVLLERKQ